MIVTELQHTVSLAKMAKRQLDEAFDIDKDENWLKKTNWNQCFKTSYSKICGITASKVLNEHAYCKICRCNVLIVCGGGNGIMKHVNGKKYKELEATL